MPNVKPENFVIRPDFVESFVTPIPPLTERTPLLATAPSVPFPTTGALVALIFDTNKTFYRVWSYFIQRRIH